MRVLSGIALSAVLISEAWGQSLADGPGKDLVQSRCTVCHDTQRIVIQHNTKAEWKVIVDRMINHGANVNADQEETITTYLATNYGPLEVPTSGPPTPTAGVSLIFDNTGGIATGVAVANTTPGPVDAIVTIRDDNGAILQSSTLSFLAYGHLSFMLNQQFSVTAGKRGTLTVGTASVGQVSVIGLRVNGSALTTLPSLSSSDTPGGAIAHATYNGGFTSVFYFANTGSESTSFTLSFFDEDGKPMSVPLALPQTGATLTTTVLSRNLAANAVLVIETRVDTAATAVAGSAKLQTSGSVRGFEIFRWTTFGQEASVPLDSHQP